MLAFERWKPWRTALAYSQSTDTLQRRWWIQKAGFVMVYWEERLPYREIIQPDPPFESLNDLPDQVAIGLYNQLT